MSHRARAIQPQIEMHAGRCCCFWCCWGTLCLSRGAWWTDGNAYGLQDQDDAHSWFCRADDRFGQDQGSQNAVWIAASGPIGGLGLLLVCGAGAALACVFLCVLGGLLRIDLSGKRTECGVSDFHLQSGGRAERLTLRTATQSHT